MSLQLFWESHLCHDVIATAVVTVRLPESDFGALRSRALVPWLFASYRIGQVAFATMKKMLKLLLSIFPNSNKLSGDGSNSRLGMIPSHQF